MSLDCRFTAFEIGRIQLVRIGPGNVYAYRTCPPFPFASTTLRLPPSTCFSVDDLFLLSLLYYIVITPSGQITLVFHYIFYAPLVNRRSSSVFQRRIKCVTAWPHKILPLLFASTVSCISIYCLNG